jgi:hypothetical protein
MKILKRIQKTIYSNASKSSKVAFSINPVIIKW